jgi:hypothetical protein
VTCVVVDTLKHQCGWLTICKGIEEDGQVVLDVKVMRGQQVEYKSFIHGDEDIIHGKAGEITDAKPVPPKPKETSDVGKTPWPQG